MMQKNVKCFSQNILNCPVLVEWDGHVILIVQTLTPPSLTLMGCLLQWPNLLWKLDAVRMKYGQDKLVMKWAYSPIMSHLSSFQNANLRAFYCVWFNSHIAYLVRNWHFLSSQSLLHRWVAWFKSHLHSRGDHFLLYFAYTCVRDLFIGGGYLPCKKDYKVMVFYM
jgi:hypothetical protein